MRAKLCSKQIKGIFNMEQPKVVFGIICRFIALSYIYICATQAPLQ